MATLPLADRQRIKRGLARWFSTLRELLAVNDADLQAAVDAADSWVDTNAASYNSALPAAFRNTATASQKSLLLVAVTLMRQHIDLLKRIFQELD